MKKKSLKIYLFLSVIFFATSITIFFFLYQTVKEKNAEAETSEIVWQEEEYQRENIESMENFLEEEATKIALLEKHFIYGSDIVPFLDLLERLAPQVGADAEVLLVDKAKDGSLLSVDVRVIGNFEAIYKFLTLIENSPYELEIISVDIQKKGGEGVESSKWEGVFKVKLLSFIP